jgi:hypothetical protein
MSSAFPAYWLSLAARAASAAEQSASTGGRHRAPETPGEVELLTSEQIAAGVGRHAEPEWSREAFDPERDDIDAFDWLGFEAAQD